MTIREERVAKTCSGCGEEIYLKDYATMLEAR